MTNNDKEILKIYETYDYGKFHLIKGNRKMKSNHLAKLQKSIVEKYLLTIVIVNENYEIIDGQNRFETAKNNNLPIRYIICEGYGIKEVQIYNLNQSNWNNIDYVNSYVEDNREDYIRLNQFREKFPKFSLETCIFLLTNSKTGDNPRLLLKTNDKFYSTTKLKAGIFKITDYNQAVKNAFKLLELSQYYEKFNSRKFVAAFLTIISHPEFDYKEFIQKLEKYNELTQICLTKKGYLLNIIKIYNYNNKKYTNDFNDLIK